MIDSKFQDQVLVSCQSDTDWKDYFDLIINSVNHTKKYEKIDKNYRIDVYLVDNSEIKDPVSYTHLTLPTIYSV